MVATIQRADRPTVVAAGALALVMATLAFVIAPATPLRIGFAIGIAIAPVLVFLAVNRPLIFPVAFLVVAAPFENLAVIPGIGTISRTLGFLCGVSLLISLLVRAKAIPAPRTVLAWAALLGWMAFSLAWSVDQNASLLAFAQIAELVALYVLVSVTPADELDLSGLIWAVIIGGGASAAFGVYLYMTDPSLIQDSVWGSTVGSRLEIAIGHQQIDPNHYANGLLPALAILLMSFLASRRIGDKAVFALATATVATGVFISASRETLIAIAAILIYYAVRSGYRRQACLVTVFFGAVALGMPNVIARFFQALADGGAGRTSVWAVGVEALRSNWLLGAGVGAFPAAYNQAFIHVFQPHFEGWDRAAHNTPLQLAVELGILGFALAAICWLSHFRLLRVVEPGSRYYDLRIALEGALVGLTVCSWFVSLWTYKYVWITFLVILVLRSRVWEDVEARRFKRAPRAELVAAPSLPRTPLVQARRPLLSVRKRIALGR